MMKRKAKILFVEQQASGECRILLGKRISSGETFWWIPGGSVEQGESDFDAGLRELDEELILSDTYLAALNAFIKSDTNPSKIEYQSANADNIIFIVPMFHLEEELPRIIDEFEELQWFPLHALPENMSREFQYIQEGFMEQVKSLFM
ncbi:MAG: NUDIX hydrolase [Cytophagales bacterium]|nr:NUDIX hydrolase [Cytophaga sp.]